MKSYFISKRPVNRSNVCTRVKVNLSEKYSRSRLFPRRSNLRTLEIFCVSRGSRLRLSRIFLPLHLLLLLLVVHSRVSGPRLHLQNARNAGTRRMHTCRWPVYIALAKFLLSFSTLRFPFYHGYRASFFALSIPLPRIPTNLNVQTTKRLRRAYSERCRGKRRTVLKLISSNPSSSSFSLRSI